MTERAAELHKRALQYARKAELAEKQHQVRGSPRPRQQRGRAGL